MGEEERPLIGVGVLHHFQCFSISGWVPKDPIPPISRGSLPEMEDLNATG